MTIRVQLDWKDYLDSSRLHMQPLHGDRISVFIPLAAFPLCLLPIAFLWLSGRLDAGLVRSWSYIAPIVAALAVLYLLYYYLYLPWSVRRIFRQQKDLSTPYELEITPDALVTTSEYGYSKRPWGDFRKWREDQKLLLLYFSDVLYTIIPKRFMSAEQLAQIHSRLAEHRVPGAGHTAQASTLAGGPTIGLAPRLLVWLLLVVAIGIMVYVGLRQPAP